MTDNQGLSSSAAGGNADDDSLGQSGGNAEDNQGAAGDSETPEQVLQKERSRFGREKSQLSKRIEELEGTLGRLSAVTSKVDLSDKPPVEYITTPEDLEKYNAWKSTQDEKKRKAYANEYVGAVKRLSYLNPELHSDIESELLHSSTNYPSPSRLSDATYDAQMNYRMAEATVLKRQLAAFKAGKPLVKGGAGNPATGITATSTNVKSGKKIVELDEVSKKFVAAMGEKEDSDFVQDSVQRQDL